jgi:hypothetical protein
MDKMGFLFEFFGKRGMFVDTHGGFQECFTNTAKACRDSVYEVE